MWQAQTERCPNWACSSGYYFHTEAHGGNVWKLLLIMLSVTNQPCPLSPQDTRKHTYGCDDSFWGMYGSQQTFALGPLVRCMDRSTPARVLCMSTTQWLHSFWSFCKGCLSKQQKQQFYVIPECIPTCSIHVNLIESPLKSLSQRKSILLLTKNNKLTGSDFSIRLNFIGLSKGSWIP